VVLDVFGPLARLGMSWNGRPCTSRELRDTGTGDRTHGLASMSRSHRLRDGQGRGVSAREYRLRLTFQRGMVGRIDLAAELWARCSSRSVTLLSSNSVSVDQSWARWLGERCRLNPEGFTTRCRPYTGELTRLRIGQRSLLDPAAQRIARYAECASDRG